MPKFKDITGQRFGKLLISGLTGEINRDRRHLWNAKCDCGRECKVISKYLINGETKSCGCLRSETCIKRNTTHGLRHTREYSIWLGIKKRCLDENHSTYKNYGRVGVSIYNPWADDFEKFLDYVGKCPDSNSTLDRINNNQGYIPGNVRWLSSNDQRRNRRKFKNNKTGVCGVGLKKRNGLVVSYVAQWKENGKSKTKDFNVNTLGNELALFMACEYREQRINFLRLCGVFYSENHGK